MSTNRNTKGRIAQKTAPKKAVKKPTQLDRIEKLYFNIIKAIDASDEAMEARLDQIQRDIDLLKSGMVKEGIDTNVVTPPAQPEEPKAEPWEPKAGMHVVFLDDTWQAKAHKGAIEVESGHDEDGHYKTIATRDYEGGIFFATSHARPATAEEIAEAERDEKLKKLVRGCRVDTPDGEGIYLGRDATSHPHRVNLDEYPLGAARRYPLDQLTPLT